MIGDAKLEIILAGKDASKKAFDSVQRSITMLTKHVFSLQGAVVGLAGAAGMGALVKSSFSVVDGLAKTADKLGITTEALAGMRHAAALTGVSQEKLDSSLERMVKRLGEASQGYGAAKKQLDAMGLSAKALIRMRPDEAFRAIAERINAMGTANERAAATAAIFGREGVALVNTLKLGAKGLDEAAAEADKFGLAVSRVDAAKIEAANDAFERAGEAVRGVGNVMAVSLAPAAEKVATEFANWVAENREFLSQDLAGAIRAIGNAAAYAGKIFERYMRWASGADLYRTQIELLEESKRKWEDLYKMYEKVNTPGNTKFLETIAQKIKLVTDKLALLRKEAKDAKFKTYTDNWEVFGTTIKNAAGAVDGLDKAKSAEKKTLDANNRAVEAGTRLYTDFGFTVSNVSRDLADISDEIEQVTREQAAAGLTFKDSWRKYEEGIDAANARAQQMLAQQAPREVSRAWEQALRNIQDDWAGVFEGMFDGTIRSFGDFTDAILGAFKRMLAEMAAEWAASEIFAGLGKVLGVNIPGVQKPGETVLGSIFGSGGSGGGGLMKAISTGKSLYSGYKWVAGGGPSRLFGGPTSGGPASSLGNMGMYAQSAYHAWSSGVGTAASWYAGAQAANMGVNAGTQLALIEGSYGAGASGATAAGAGSSLSAAGIGAGGVYAAAAMIAADVAQMIFTGKPGMLGSLLSKNNPPYAGGIEYATAWKNNRAEVRNAYGEMVPVDESKGISESWKASISEMRRVFDVDMNDVFQTNWDDLERTLSGTLDTGAGEIQVAALKSVREYVRAAQRVEQSWASMNEAQRKATADMMRESYQVLRDKMAEAFTAGADTLGSAVNAAISAAKLPPVEVRVSGSAPPASARDAWENQRSAPRLEGGGAAWGGVYSGPDTGYLALLHGTERVVPVKDTPAPLPGGGGMAQINIYVDNKLKHSEVVRLAEGVVKKYRDRNLGSHHYLT